MSRLLDAYRAFHEQGFIPIFVDDDFDSRMLLEACIGTGLKGIEYTLRRRDALTMIPWIRENYPDLYVLVGSTIDDDRIVAHCRRRFPQLLTVSELDSMEVDGFVSMMSWDEESIKKYSPTRVVIPSAYTVNEAYSQVRAGAGLDVIVGEWEHDLSDHPLVRCAREHDNLIITPHIGGVTWEAQDMTLQFIARKLIENL